jgi:hypothetical protein
MELSALAGISKKPVVIVLAVLIGAIIGFGVLTLAQIVSAEVRDHQFESATRTEARLAVADLRPVETIRSQLCQKAQDLNLPVQADDIKVLAVSSNTDLGSLLNVLHPTSETSSKTGVVVIDVAYSVPIRLPGFSFALNFKFRVDDHTV